MSSNEYESDLVYSAVQSLAQDRNAMQSSMPRFARLARQRFAVTMNMIEIAVETGDGASDP